MILFLNFIPIEFMGGTEKWMNNTAKTVQKYEEARVLSIHPHIANAYGMIVPKRKYDSRINESELHNHLSLNYQSFMPFTKKWKNTKNIFLKSRLIYTRYEILEFLIVMYFSGISGFKKTIAGVHSPFMYSDPISFFDKLHNVIYGSVLYKFMFRQIKRVHVLNRKDKKYLNAIFKLQNVVYVPNGVANPKVIRNQNANNNSQLRVLFVGELSMRKGVDVLIKIIKHAPKHIKFTIAGDGFFKKEMISLVKKYNNVEYQGYVGKRKLDQLYREHEVLILPSRAESMSLALLEAISYGLVIIDSKNIKLGLDKRVEFSCDNKNIKSYLITLKKLSNMKKLNKLNKIYIKTYFTKNFLSSTINQKLSKNIFEINV